MLEVIPVPLTVIQIRLLREVTLAASREEADRAGSAKSTKAKEKYLLRGTRLGELAEVFEKTCP